MCCHAYAHLHVDMLPQGASDLGIRSQIQNFQKWLLFIVVSNWKVEIIKLSKF